MRFIWGVMGGLAATVALAPAAHASGASGTVNVDGSVLNVRAGPGTDHSVVAKVADGASLTVECQVAGERISGAERRTAVWLRIGEGQYVTDAYVRWRDHRPDLAWCAGSAAVYTGDGAPLHIRGNASTMNGATGAYSDGAALPVRCHLGGEQVAGTERETSMWLQVGDGEYVSAAYARWQPEAPELVWCDQPTDPAPDDRREFIEWAAAHAQHSRDQYRVPVSVSIAQAINESGWGRSGLSREGNAYFGIKCFATPGAVAAGCRPYDTSECNDDGCYDTVATFRVYRSAADSFLDHGRFLTENPRYAPAFVHVDDPDRFAREIHRAGYATDPDYTDKLLRLMRQYDLYQYDR